MSFPESPKNDTQRYLARIAGHDVVLPERPRTNVQRYLAKIAGQDVVLPDFPRTVEEIYLYQIAVNGGGGGGGGADLSALEVYIADFLADPPAVTEGALNAFHRTLVS